MLLPVVLTSLDSELWLWTLMPLDFLYIILLLLLLPGFEGPGVFLEMLVVVEGLPLVVNYQLLKTKKLVLSVKV